MAFYQNGFNPLLTQLPQVGQKLVQTMPYDPALPQAPQVQVNQKPDVSTVANLLKGQDKPQQNPMAAQIPKSNNGWFDTQAGADAAAARAGINWSPTPLANSGAEQDALMKGRELMGSAMQPDMMQRFSSFFGKLF